MARAKVKVGAESDETDGHAEHMRAVNEAAGGKPAHMPTIERMQAAHRSGKPHTGEK